MSVEQATPGRASREILVRGGHSLPTLADDFERAAAAEDHRFFYRYAHYIPEADDVVGTEVWIVYARDKFWATVQVAEGEPDPPVVVPVEVSGNRVKFTTSMPLQFSTGEPAPAEITKYSGTVSKTGLILSVEGNPGTLLKRRNSYRQ